MTSPPDIAFSVIIPAYNMQDEIGACLTSVFKQTCQDFEILVIDDASTDNTRSIVEQFADPRLRILHRSPGGPGPGPARNLGIANARGRWCAFLDADDAWDPTHLERFAQAGAALPTDVGFLFSGFRIQEAGRPTMADGFSQRHVGSDLKTFDFGAFLEAWIENRNSPNRTSATVIRKDVLDRAGGFPQGVKCKQGEDKDLWLRVAAITRAAYLPMLSMTYLSAPKSDSAERAWFSHEPCICDTVSALMQRSEFAAHRSLLKRLRNAEIYDYVRGAFRVGVVRHDVFRGFYGATEPMKLALICLLWLASHLGAWKLVRFRNQMRRRRNQVQYGATLS